MIKNHEFSKLFPRGTELPMIDAIRDTLKVMDIGGLKQINQHIIKKSVENKVFENGTIDGYTVVAIDRTKFFGSNKKSCARWDIENSIFNNLKTECGLEHCFVHGGKAVESVLYLIFIASNIMQLFLLRRLKKQFATQREMVRLLLKGLYLLKYQAELVFSSS